jgi:hypothetical protein
MESFVATQLDRFSNDGGVGNDFAINGGLIIDSSITYNSKNGFFTEKPNPPSTILSSVILPGACWCFEGSKGFVKIEIQYDIIPTAFTLDVPPIQIGNYNTAPKDFEVYGNLDQEYVLLGKWKVEYGKKTIQTFQVDSEMEKKFNTYTLKINENYGSPIATCIYRFRIHGKSASIKV